MNMYILYYENVIMEKTPQVTDTPNVWYLMENFNWYANYSLEIFCHTDEFAET